MKLRMKSIHITDPCTEELKIFCGTSEPQLLHYYEPEPGIFIAESPMIISRALYAGYKPEAFLIEERNDLFVEKILDQCLETSEYTELPEDIPVYSAPLDVLVGITGYTFTRGVLCAMRRRQLPAPADMMASSKRVVVLENVMNPTNLGAIFRNAAALGMDAVFLTKGSTDPLYRRAARVSMGTVFQIPWTYINSSLSGIYELKKKGFRTIAMALSDDAESLKDIKVKSSEKLAVIMGTEGPGLIQETIDSCDSSVIIPMSHGVDSLNVAAASAVAFWQINCSGDCF